MLLNSGFDNRQPQAGAAGLAVARLVGPVEWPENLFAILRADARAVVIDVNRNPVFIHREADGNLRVRVAQGVAHDILQRAFQRIGVTVQRPRTRRILNGERFPHLLGFKRRVVQHFAPQLIGFDRLADQGVFRLIARHHQQVVDHAVQPVRFSFDALQLLALTAAAAQQGGAQLQARKRRAQLVRDIGQ